VKRAATIPAIVSAVYPSAVQVAQNEPKRLDASTPTQVHEMRVKPGQSPQSVWQHSLQYLWHATGRQATVGDGCLSSANRRGGRCKNSCETRICSVAFQSPLPCARPLPSWSLFNAFYFLRPPHQISSAWIILHELKRSCSVSTDLQISVFLQRVHLSTALAFSDKSVNTETQRFSLDDPTSSHRSPD
jgi:hypothetical protein